MSETVVVRHLIAGTVTEDTWTGDRVTYQQFPDGRAKITLHRGGQVAETIAYRNAERIHRVLSPRRDA